MEGSIIIKIFKKIISLSVVIGPCLGLCFPNLSTNCISKNDHCVKSKGGVKLVYTDYNNCLVNLSNSILKYYGISTEHKTLETLDKYLSREYKNIVLLLYDGFGSNLIKKHLGETSFLHKNQIKNINSVFPATTVAATTSLITGKNPVEHCWLGWDIYIKSIDKTVTTYKNTFKGTNTKVADFSIVKSEFPYVTIFEKINKNKKAIAHYISPYEGTTYDSDSPDQMYDKIVELCKNNNNNFIYAYCPEPDRSMHNCGTDDKKVIEIMKELNTKTQKMCEQLENTLIIVTADHGHMNVKQHIIIDDYPILKNMLVRETSLEPRTVNFFVKEGMKQRFEKEFNKLFGDDFILVSKQKVIDRKLFGDGLQHKKFDSCLGDYLAIATSDKCIDNTYSEPQLKGLHAGLTEDEVFIPLIVVER